MGINTRNPEKTFEVVFLLFEHKKRIEKQNDIK